MPKAEALPSSQQTGLPRTWRSFWLLPRPGPPRRIKRLRWPWAKPRRKASKSRYVATRMARRGNGSPEAAATTDGSAFMLMAAWRMSAPVFREAFATGRVVVANSEARPRLARRAGERDHGRAEWVARIKDPPE